MTRQSNRGFGLIEVMIAVAISAVVVYGVASMMSKTMKVENSVKRTAEIDNWASLISLQAGINCNGLLVGGTPSNLVNPAYQGATDVQFVAGSLPALPTGVNIVSTKLRNLSVSPPTEAPYVYAGQVEITFNKGAGAVGAPQIMRSVVVAVTANPPTGASANLITSCAGAGSVLAQRQQACSDIGGTFDLTKTPPCQLVFPTPSSSPSSGPTSYLCLCMGNGAPLTTPTTSATNQTGSACTFQNSAGDSSQGSWLCGASQ